MPKSKIQHLYDQNKDRVWPIDPSVDIQKTKWMKKCPTCDITVEITHGSAWNIVTGKFDGNCKKCAGKKTKNSGWFEPNNTPWNLGCYGEKSHQWQGGKTKETHRKRNTREFKIFKKSVLERDNYACVNCGSTHKLEVDHIKPTYLYPELFVDINNGRTLCHSCHVKTETYGPKVKKLKKDTNCA